MALGRFRGWSRYAVGVLRFVQPCSPVTVKSVPAGEVWLHEPKLDGFRLQVAKGGPAVRLDSRRTWQS
jgi:ATP-dependent DNA ligase